MGMRSPDGCVIRAASAPFDAGTLARPGRHPESISPALFGTNSIRGASAGETIWQIINRARALRPPVLTMRALDDAASGGDRRRTAAPAFCTTFHPWAGPCAHGRTGPATKVRT